MLTTENPFAESDGLLKDENDVRTALNTKREQIKLLFKTAFAKGDEAHDRYTKLCWKPYSPERIIQTLEGGITRWVNFGMIKRNLADPTVALEAKKALALLPQALRQEHELATNLGIIYRTRNAAIDRELLDVNARDNARYQTIAANRQRERERSRQDEEAGRSRDRSRD